MLDKSLTSSISTWISLAGNFDCFGNEGGGVWVVVNLKPGNKSSTRSAMEPVCSWFLDGWRCLVGVGFGCDFLRLFQRDRGGEGSGLKGSEYLSHSSFGWWNSGWRNGATSLFLVLLVNLLNGLDQNGSSRRASANVVSDEMSQQYTNMANNISGYDFMPVVSLWISWDRKALATTLNALDWLSSCVLQPAYRSGSPMGTLQTPPSVVLFDLTNKYLRV